MIIKLQLIDPERLDRRFQVKKCIFLGARNRIDFMNGLGASEDRSWGYPVKQDG